MKTILMSLIVEKTNITLDKKQTFIFSFLKHFALYFVLFNAHLKK